jgi:hypothetical protein
MPVRDDWAARALVPRDDPRKSLVRLALVAVAGAYNCRRVCGSGSWSAGVSGGVGSGARGEWAAAWWTGSDIVAGPPASNPRPDVWGADVRHRRGVVAEPPALEALRLSTAQG